MKNKKRILTMCAIALVLTLGVIEVATLGAKIDPPFTLVNLL